ncbi:sensor histidine kinase [Goodfellowiella coeruleoviolacea]|uniref:Anti-sigma regulatory factor (Ser/Thr protein kinase) n=1 Tax=Goodfellowiella coeruleoviolacea TaxID=334858 RepID=A0AAE3GFV1_9PSEU|nr:sensor histidine kinase [Goodfellowiella coeruleoviolacea]MCP2166559.1 Anti-sigma regulatory factor (Ser/Thr protein kinase) [Goodfellowiella coeruleoviolacea]
MSAVTASSPAPDPFVHEALLYRDAAEFVAGTLPFVEAGLAAGEPVLVSVPAANVELLRASLGEHASRVRFLNMTEAGRNPGAIIPCVLLDFAATRPDSRVRIIGEPIWAGRSAVEYPACVQHEALINAAFAGRPTAILCPYDATRLTPEVLADAELTHPVLFDREHRWTSASYDDPVLVAERFNRPLAAAPPSAASLDFDITGLAGVRRLAAERSVAAGLSAERVDDVVLVVNELATNSITHGPGRGRLRVWREADTVVCEVYDTGRLTNPLAGRIPPAHTGNGGYGLILVNRLTDLVRIHSDAGGTTVRVYLSLAVG